jgi:hypothetical protein
MRPFGHRNLMKTASWPKPCLELLLDSIGHNISQVTTHVIRRTILSEPALNPPDVTKLGLHLFPKEVKDSLIAIGEQRLKDMDKGDIVLQVTFHTPLLESPDVCRKPTSRWPKPLKRAMADLQH